MRSAVYQLKNSFTRSIHDLALGSVYRNALGDFIELAQDFLLPRGQADRRLHHYLAQQIALHMAAHAANPLATQAEDLARLGFVRNLDLATPSSVGISISPPSAAVAKLIGISHSRSLPSRANTECGLMCAWIYRSPLGPPFCPAHLRLTNGCDRLRRYRPEFSPIASCAI